MQDKGDIVKVKMIKFNLPLNEKSCRTKKDIAENFNLLELLAYYYSGRLTLWCRVRKLMDEVEILEEIKSEDEERIGEKLCDMFEVEKQSVKQEKKKLEKQKSEQEEVKRKAQEEKREQEEARKKKEEEERNRKEKKAQERLNITAGKIKCIRISNIDEFNLTNHDNIIPLFLNYNHKETNRRPKVILASKDKDKDKDKDKSMEVYLSHIKFQSSDIPGTMILLDYKLYNGVKIKALGNIAESNFTYYFYIYDVDNKIKGCEPKPFTETAIKLIGRYISRDKLLQGIKGA